MTTNFVMEYLIIKMYTVHLELFRMELTVVKMTMLESSPNMDRP